MQTIMTPEVPEALEVCGMNFRITRPYESARTARLPESGARGGRVWWNQAGVSTGRYHVPPVRRH